MSRRLRLGAAGVLGASLVLPLAACGYQGPQSLPLPGGKGGGGYEVTIVLEDATNLVAKQTCRSGDVVVGQVASVELNEALQAEVVCQIEKDVALPANVVATLRETSLLGERYIALDPPTTDKATGRLAAGSTIPANRTTAQPVTEMVLGALSMVLNGGSLGSIETISRELNAALERPGDIKTTSRRLASLMKTLDGRRGSLVSALESLSRLTTTLADQRTVLAEALDAVPDGIAALQRQEPALVKALARLSRLSDTAVPLIKRSKNATVADLRHLVPVLDQLDLAKKDLSRTVERLSSFPFSRNALSTIKGDYAGMYGQALVNIDTINALLVSLAQAAAPAPASAVTPASPAAPAPGPKGASTPTVRGLRENLDLSTLLGNVVDGVGSTLDLSSLLAPGRPSDATGTTPRGLGELLTGGGS